MNPTVRRAFRAFVFCLVRMVCRTKPGGPIDAKAIRKILVIRVDPRVGDLLLTTPLVRALKKGLPNAQIHLWIAAGKEKLVTGLAHEIHLFRKKDFFRHPIQFWRAVRAIRREKFDAVVDASHWHTISFTSAVLAFLTGAPIRIGHQRDRSELFFTHPVVKDPSNDREVPSKLELLSPLNVPSDGEAMETTVDAKRSESGVPIDGEFLALPESIAQLVGEGGYVAFNPGARKSVCRWSPEGFGRLAKSIRDEMNVLPLILFGPGEEEIALRVVAASEGRAVLAPPTDLASLAASFRHSRLVVTNDTGPMHLAVATGTPVLAVFTLETGPRWAPKTGRFFQGVTVDGVSDVSSEALDRLAGAAGKLLTPTAEIEGAPAQSNLETPLASVDSDEGRAL